MAFAVHVGCDRPRCELGEFALLKTRLGSRCMFCVEQNAT